MRSLLFFLTLVLFSVAHSDPASYGFARAIWQANHTIRLNRPLGASLYSGTRSNQLSFFLSKQSPQKLSLREAFEFDGALPLKTLRWDGSSLLLDASDYVGQIDTLIRGPLSLVTINENGIILDRTHLQLAPILDSYYFEDGSLGLVWERGTPSFRLWAPTASKVRLRLLQSPSGSSAQYVEMGRSPRGVWSVEGDPRWKSRYYQYEVTVFYPQTSQEEVFLVTDPYSVSLSSNGEYSTILNWEDASLKPPGWDQISKPVLNSIRESIIYEVHLRDWTSGDPGIPDSLRGTFLGLTFPKGKSFEYLKHLARSGLTHIHLLPIADFASVDEDRLTWKTLPNLGNVPPYSADPQGELGKIRDQDSYNWGYDPVHYFSPEGSYATNPNDGSRVLELRTLVQSLNQIGLRVVQDVVFNHTYENGLTRYSVFDKIVPLYYYRLDENGLAMNSSCCADTASENRMMEKLMIDAVLFWAKTYKIDGFRFDLMNLHTRDNILRLQKKVRSLSLREHGVDGSKILLYGEGWEFGSLEYQKPGQAFFNSRVGGTHIGTFNDRMRDALRGGTTNATELSDPGFLTGLYYDHNFDSANRNTPLSPEQQREKLLFLGDVVKIGLAANLTQYQFFDFQNNWIAAGYHFFRGARTSFSSNPEETVSYVSAHDGYTLWDAIQAKLPFQAKQRFPSTATIEERSRVARMALAVVVLGQGTPFIEAGSDLLRSKSGDQDSYNSGDWFNHIDFSFESNNWGVGLPPSWKNSVEWKFWKPRLESQDLMVNRNTILESAQYFLALLKVRRSTPLFHLPSGESIQRCVKFPKDDLTGGAIPGLIAMEIENQDQKLTSEKSLRRIFVLFNANRSSQRIQVTSLKNHELTLHPNLNEQVDPTLRQVSFDKATGMFDIPGRTTVVFEEPL